MNRIKLAGNGGIKKSASPVDIKLRSKVVTNNNRAYYIIINRAGTKKVNNSCCFVLHTGWRTIFINLKPFDINIKQFLVAKPHSSLYQTCTELKEECYIKYPHKVSPYKVLIYS